MVFRSFYSPTKNITPLCEANINQWKLRVQLQNLYRKNEKNTSGSCKILHPGTKVCFITPSDFNPKRYTPGKNDHVPLEDVCLRKNRYFWGYSVECRFETNFKRRAVFSRILTALRRPPILKMQVAWDVVKGSMAQRRSPKKGGFVFVATINQE